MSRTTSLSKARAESITTKQSRFNPHTKRRIRLGLWLALVGLFVAVVLDVVPLIGAKATVPDAADAVAAAAASSVKYSVPTSLTVRRAYDAAVIKAAEYDVTVLEDGFTQNADGTVTLTVERVVPSRVLERVPWFADWFVQRATTTHGPQVLS